MAGNIERLITVNLSDAYGYKRSERTDRAVYLLKRFIAKNSKVTVDDVRLSMALNSFIWGCGRHKPRRNVKVKLIKDGDIARVYIHDEKIEGKKTEEKKPEKKEQAKEAEKPKEAEKTDEKQSDRAPKKEEKVRLANEKKLVKVGEERLKG